MITRAHRHFGFGCDVDRICAFDDGVCVGVGAVFSGTGVVCGSVCFKEDPEKVILIYLYNYRDSYNGSPKIQLLNF